LGFRERRAFEFPEFPAEGPKLETILDAEVSGLAQSLRVDGEN